MINEYRRFIMIGTETQENRLSALIEQKSLSREDLLLILQTIKINPYTYFQFQQVDPVNFHHL